MRGRRGWPRRRASPWYACPGREVRARGGRKPQARALFTTAQQPSCSERSNNADGRGRRAPRRAECAALRSLPAWPWVAAARRLSALRGGRRARLWPWLALTMIHPTHCRQMRCAPRVAGRGVTAVVLRKTLKLPFVHWSLCQSQFVLTQKSHFSFSCHDFFSNIARCPGYKRR